MGVIFGRIFVEKDGIEGEFSKFYCAVVACPPRPL